MGLSDSGGGGGGGGGGGSSSGLQCGAVLSPRQVRKFGRDGLKVEFVEAGVHETLVVTRPTEEH